jgi:hypothetical protein
VPPNHVSSRNSGSFDALRSNVAVYPQPAATLFTPIKQSAKCAEPDRNRCKAALTAGGIGCAQLRGPKKSLDGISDLRPGIFINILEDPRTLDQDVSR